MNKLSQLIENAETSIHELAEQLDVDVLEVAMAKRCIGFTHFDTVCALADALECDIEDIYPTLAGHVEAFDEEGISLEEMRARMISEDHLQVLVDAGIDPDPERWFVILKLKSGNERRYRIASGDLQVLTEEIETAENSEGFFVFTADCRTIVLRKSAMKQIQIRNEASYARFSSNEDANHLTIVSTTSPRPEAIEVEPDLPGAGPESCPITMLIQKAMNNEPIGPYFKMEDEGDDRYINLDEMELLEIPLGLVMPHLYEYEVEEAFSDGNIPLEDMIPAGNA
ncbi:hypothetical protein [Mesorhizobium sp. SP-1A]|uniref:hypothetical protein n=1 Tax=Mesorhizobium sp. SP-1A TaxID=3077840 RepID=UPI0028F704B7|nr:hypothetical protein [Mesorhizobium sp. SP-1A]